MFLARAGARLFVLATIALRQAREQAIRPPDRRGTRRPDGSSSRSGTVRADSRSTARRRPGRSQPRCVVANRQRDVRLDIGVQLRTRFRRRRGAGEGSARVRAAGAKRRCSVSGAPAWHSSALNRFKRQPVHRAESAEQAGAAGRAEQAGQQQRRIVAVVERAEQHHEQQQREREAEAGRQYVDATAIEADRQRLGACAAASARAAVARRSASVRARRSAIVAAIGSADRRHLEQLQGQFFAVALRARAGRQAVAGDERKHGLHVLGHAMRPTGQQRVRTRRCEQCEAGARRQADADPRAGGSRRAAPARSRPARRSRCTPAHGVRDSSTICSGTRHGVSVSSRLAAIDRAAASRVRHRDRDSPCSCAA